MEKATTFEDLLGVGSAESFFAETWGRHPWLARQTVREFVDRVALEQLTELATREEVPTRIFQRDPEGDLSMETGPFPSSAFQSIPQQNWTLLVQECDRYLLPCRELMDRARFVPNWRMDDAMVSYATPGGGVGPHVDRYDVLLIQLTGRREWRFASTPTAPATCGDPGELSLPCVEVLKPGDLLYLPAHFAHDGVALDPCVTLSIGFRTPNQRDFAQQFFLNLPEPALARHDSPDQELRRSPSLGEITAGDLDWLRDGLIAPLKSDAFMEWSGRYLTRPPRQDVLPAGQQLRSVEELWGHLEAHGSLRRLANSYFAWTRSSPSELLLFIGGESYHLDNSLLESCQQLCNETTFDLELLRAPLSSSPEFAAVVCDAILRGYLLMERRT